MLNRTVCIKMDLALNNQERLICHKTQTNKSNQSYKNAVLKQILEATSHKKVDVWTLTSHLTSHKTNKTCRALLKK